jgi:hypothetical protein
MADYGKNDTVENEAYCMNSWQKRNTDDMNEKMGYNNMADRANAAHPPTPVKAAKSNPQLSPQMPGNNQYNYDGNR